MTDGAPMDEGPYTRGERRVDEVRTLALRIQVDRGGAAIRLTAPHGVRVDLPDRHAADVVARIRQRVEEARLARQSPGAGLYGDLFSGPAAGPAEEAIAWASSGPGRRLHVVVVSCDGMVGEWPLELLTHSEHGLIGAQPWCRVLRAPFGGWPGADDSAPADPGPAVSAQVQRRIGRWRLPLERRLRALAEETVEASRWQEALAFLRSLRDLQSHGARPAARARTLALLARALDWTEGDAAALDAAEEAAALAGRARDPLLQRLAWRFSAELLARRGDVPAAERLLERCIDVAVRLGDVATEADDRTFQVRLRFDQRRDLEAVLLAPPARRACRRSGRLDLEGQLDVALARGAQRHGHVRAARNLFVRGARRLGLAGRPEEAAAAGTHLGFLFLRGKRDDLAVAVFVAALRTALDAADAGRDAAGVVVEGLLAPLLQDVGPHLLRRRRPDAVAAAGLLLLMLAGPRHRTHELAPPPDPLRLVVAWFGRYLRLVGWVAAGGAVVEDGVSRVVADRVSKRARRVALEIERLSGGVLPATRLHEEAVAAAHREIRRRGP